MIISLFCSWYTIIFHALSRVIAPPVCAHCGCFLERHSTLCITCKQLIKPLVSYSLSITKNITIPILAVGKYEGPLKRLILAKGRSDIVASYELGHLVADYIERSAIVCDYIVPVPLHWTRYAYRGYNQAECIASVVAERIGVPIVPLVRRIRATSQQSAVAADKRLDNVSSAFSLMQADLTEYRNKRIFLVDDVLTTGATIKEVVKELNKVSPSAIVVVVAARVI